MKKRKKVRNLKNKHNRIQSVKKQDSGDQLAVLADIFYDQVISVATMRSKLIKSYLE